MRWYLAGPMTGYPEANYPAFREACRVLRKSGWSIVSPHEVAPHPETLPTKQNYQNLLRIDLQTLLDCDGIILMPGWSQSTGARLELHVALSTGKKVQFFDGAGLKDIS